MAGDGAAGKKRRAGNGAAASTKIDQFFKQGAKRARVLPIDGPPDKSLATARKLRLPTEPASLWSPSKAPAKPPTTSLLDRIQQERKLRDQAVARSQSVSAVSAKDSTTAPMKKPPARQPLTLNPGARPKVAATRKTPRTAAALFSELEKSVVQKAEDEQKPIVAKRLSFSELPASQPRNLLDQTGLQKRDGNCQLDWQSSADSARRGSSSNETHSSITYDKSQLPKQHWNLIELMDGLESAYAILRGRKEATCLSRMRQMVERSSSRAFKLEHFEQLLWALPDDFEVLPPRGGDKSNFEISLSDTTELSKTDLTSSPFKRRQTGSAILGRRQRLHDRLRDHVRHYHDEFLSTLTRPPAVCHVHLWHPDFDVSSVPRVPRKPISRSATKGPEPQSEPPRTPVKAKVAVNFVSDRPTTPPPGETPAGSGFIPEGLLRRVRRREASSIERVRSGAAKLDREKLLLSVLPGTVDVINSIFTQERRSAMGGDELLGKLVLQHPRRWPKIELQEQLSFIVRTVPDWFSCKQSVAHSLSPKKPGLSNSANPPKLIYRVHPKKMSYAAARQQIILAKGKLDQ